MSLIIVIEDNEAIRENTAELLELEGFSVMSACNGEEGLRLIFEQGPDLIISDVHMPGKNGYEVLELVRQSEKTRNIPFVFLTSDSEKKDIESGLQRGAAGYLVKPFRTEELYATVKSFVQESI